MPEPRAPTIAQVVAAAMDPTAATTAQTQREIATLREILEARLDGMDRAIILTQQYPTLLDRAVDAIKAEIEAAISTLRDLHGEKFNAIGVQFAERDIRQERTSQDRKDAIYAELESQKAAVKLLNDSNTQAIGKSEAAFTKQIDSLDRSLQAIAKASDDKIGDLKDRLTIIEGRSQGAGNLWALIGGAVGLLIAVALGVAALMKG